MNKYQIFISSTYEDLKQERQEVIKAALEMGHLPVGMELFPPTDEKSWQLIQDVIGDSDYFVLIIAGRYGDLYEDRIGYTEMEYDYAISKKKPIIALLHSNPLDLPLDKKELETEALERLSNFRKKISQNHNFGRWNDFGSLLREVNKGINSAIVRHPSTGWQRVRPDKQYPLIHRNLFEADSAIVTAIRCALSPSDRDSLLDIYVLGGRIRTIHHMLEQVLQDIDERIIQTENVVFTICCFAPDYMSDWTVTQVKNVEKFQQSLEMQKQELRGHISELKSYNNRSSFRHNHIEVNIMEYSKEPTIYGFVVGESDIFWGAYSWNDELEDYVGPLNPCVQMNNKMENFQACKDVLMNRVIFWSLSGSEQTKLDHVLRTNLKAYDTIAKDYHTRATDNAKKMGNWLDPVQRQLSSAFNNKPITMLDVGSGDGFMANYFAKQGHKVTAIDFSPAMCQNIRKYDAISDVIEDDFLKYDFCRQRFDCVVAVAFIHLFPSPWDLRVIERVRDILEDNGIVYIATTIQADTISGYRKKDDFPRNPIRFRQHYTRESFEQLLQKGGFSVIDSYDADDFVIKDKRWMNFIIKKSGSKQ